MTNHSSTIAKKIAWMEELRGLQSMESQSQTRLSHFTLLVIHTQICSFNTTKDYVRVQEGREKLLHIQGQERWP